GVVVATLLWLNFAAIRTDERHRTRPVAAGRVAAARGYLRLVLSTPVLLSFVFFATLSLVQIGTQAMSIGANMALFGIDLALAGWSVTVLLLGSAAGILIGGVLADRSERQDVLVASGAFLAACFTFLI